VLAAAIILESVSLVLFLVAGDVLVLGLARVAQGVATGAAITTLGAALVDLQPQHAPGRAGLINGVAPLSGLAAGALGSGALVQLAPAPTHLVYAVLLAGMLLAAGATALLPETATRRPGARASLQPHVELPRELRADVLGLVPILVASWALGGLYLSLGPSVATSLPSLHSHLIGGLVVTLLCGTGAATAVALRTTGTARVLRLAATLSPAA
jgi:MFS family permease